jgi:hypothetical protein
MDDIIVGSEALAAGLVTRHQLRTNYDKLHYNVYAQAGMQLDAADRARAAWLWSRRTATLVGISAAAMHGTNGCPMMPRRSSHTPISRRRLASSYTAALSPTTRSA